MNHFDLGGDGAPLHFLHANGYPPECYRPLLELLHQKFHVFGMKLRPLWDDAKMDGLKSWHPFSDDLLCFLSSLPWNSPSPDSARADPVIGVGHSVGGVVTLRAALRNPQRFRALILLDPVILTPPAMTAWIGLHTLRLQRYANPIVSDALNRRTRFQNLELVFRGYRGRKIFRYMSDENLRIYIEGMTRKTEAGTFELVYSPLWEAHIYMTALRDFDLWRQLPKFEIPTLIIRGAETDTFLPGAEKLVKKRNPKIQVHTMEKSTHILPLEHPQEVFDIIRSFLNEAQKVS